MSLPSRDIKSACYQAAGTLVGLSIVVNIAALGLPLYTLQIFDRVLYSGSIETLVMLSVGLGLMGVLYLSFDFLRRRVPKILGWNLERALTHHMLMADISGSSQSNEQDYPLWRLPSLLRQLLANPGLYTALDALFAPLFILVLFTLHSGFGTVVVVGNLLLLASAWFQAKALRGLAVEGQRRRRKIESVNCNALQSGRSLLAMGMLNDWVDLSRVYNDKACDAQKRIDQISDRYSFICASIKWLVQAALPTLGAVLLIRQAITPGELLAAMIIGVRTLAPLEALISCGESLLHVGELLRLISGQLKSPSAGIQPPQNIEGLVSVRQLSISHPQGAQALLSNIDIEVRPGEILMVIGPSGSGKSLLLEAIMGLHPPTEGTICFDNGNVKHWDKTWLGRQIGYVPQNIEFPRASISETICRYQHPDKKVMVAVAKSLGVHNSIMKLPEGYDTCIGQGGIRLSGSLSHRIALCRAAYCDPKLWLLDMIDSNLDPQGMYAFVDTIKAAKAKASSIVLTTQRKSLLDLADYILVLDQGHVGFYGSREAFFQRSVKPRRGQKLSSIKKYSNSDTNVPITAEVALESAEGG